VSVGALDLGNVFCFVAGAPMVLLGDLGLEPPPSAPSSPC
jgi:hypothetical protein